MSATILLLVLWIPVVFGEERCQFPDFPEHGTYLPKKEKYLPGDTITYACDRGYLRIGDEKKTCEASGIWSGLTPFCDAPVKLKDPSASSYADRSSTVGNVIDKKTSTCVRTKEGAKQNVKIYLDKPARVNVIRINLPKGRVNITAYALQWKSRNAVCDFCDLTLESPRWVELFCDGDFPASEILVEQNGPSRPLEICEVEVYVREEKWCIKPPKIIIPNGRLKINRQRATLECNQNYKEGSTTRLVCNKDEEFVGGLLMCNEILCNRMEHEQTKGGFWRVMNRSNKLTVGTEKELKCEKDYVIEGSPVKVTCRANGTWTESTAKCIEKKKSSAHIKYIIIGCVVGAIILLSCFGLLLYLVKKKSKPVVVVVNQGENAYTAQSGSSTGSCNTAEYATINYDECSPEITPKSIGLQMKVVKDYSNPLDGISPNKTAYSKFAHVPTYMVPQDSFPMEFSSDSYGSLKMSPLYGPTNAENRTLVK